MNEIANLLPVSNSRWRIKCMDCPLSRDFNTGQSAAYRSARNHWQKFSHHRVEVIAETIVFTFSQPDAQMSLDDVPPF